MEGNERANVEARIKCLRNIQVLLDAAVMEMQQYSSVVSQLDMNSRKSNQAGTSTANGSATASSQPEQKSPKSDDKARDSSSHSKSTEAKSEADSEAKAEVTSAGESSSRPLATAETGARSKIKTNEPSVDKDTSAKSDNNVSEDQNEVRQRRLEKFLAPKKDSE